MYSRILVPTDGSPGTASAIEHAVEHARTYDATLHTLYVVDTTIAADAGVAGVYGALEDTGREAIDAVRTAAARAGVDAAEASLARGAPYRVILDYVDENDIDLVVMGTHGRRGLERYLLGSTTEKVVRLADVPVLTVRMTDDSA
ncbi:universal stress protein [Haloarcula marina]|uniref:universal stress protein n=1 Tax=Haloarcula marina TaxID=2961574 RepID=UPI0020B7771A|nr:universal stress protein [Halomicroarcula marina]